MDATFVANLVSQYARPICLSGKGRLFFGFVVAFLIAMSMYTFDIGYAVTFGETSNISNTETPSDNPVIALGENGEVFIAWREANAGSDVQFASRIDSDSTFNTPVNLDEGFVLRDEPRIATTDDIVFIVWSENDEIFIVNGTVDADGDVEFGSPVNLSNNTGQSRNPQIAAFGNDVVIAWEDDTDQSSTDIFYAMSTNSGMSFGAAINLSETDGESLSPQLVFSESGNLYIAWQDDDPNSIEGTAIFFRASTNSGSGFGDKAILNISDGAASNPVIVPYATNNVYLVWGDGTGTRDIFLSLGSVNNDATTSFGDIINVSNNLGSSSSAEAAVATDGTVYVAWVDDLDGGNDILISNRTNEDASFSFPVNLTHDASITDGSLHIKLLPQTEDLFLVWRDNSIGNGDIFFGEIKNNGHDISVPVNLSANNGNSQLPVLEVFNDSIFVSWQDRTSGNYEILFLDISTAENEPPVINIQQPEIDNAKWGRIMTISGTTNGDEGDSITIDWGDGSLDPNIAILDNSWGPVDHSYNSSSVGSNFVVAKLSSSNGEFKATSDPLEITVTKHETSLTIDDISRAVIQGDNVTVTGSLTDLDDDIGVEGLISFNGTGATGLDTITTHLAGDYSAEGPSPNSVSTLWTINAIFAGDSSYEGSSSIYKTFDTVSTESAEFTVLPGAPSVVELNGFNVSINFDEILFPETLYVASCETPENARYSSIGICLSISMAGSLPEGAYAHLTVSYAQGSIPEGHSEDEIDIFHETIEGYVDITESRDTEENTVTGRTSNFSRFVIAIAMHDTVPDGSIRKQVFVGKNDILFHELVPRAINFDSSEYAIGSTVIVTINDETVNDPAIFDSVLANITSESDSTGITISLNETGANMGTFVGNFTLATDASSSGDRVLSVGQGDMISGVYASSARGPIRVVIDDVIESGLIEVQTSSVNENHVPDFDPISDAYRINLVDAQIANGSDVAIIMSYANVDLRNNEIVSVNLFRVLQFDPESISSGAFEWFDISSATPDSIDTIQKTVTGMTTSFSNFTIGHDVRSSGPGGAGGGPVKSGVVILDSAASVQERVGEETERTNRNGGSGNGVRSTTLTQTPSGSDIRTIVRTDLGIVTLQFESVGAGSGNVKVDLNDLAALEGLFDEIVLLPRDNEEHGILTLSGKTYSTASSVFDIDVSSVEFEGLVNVTIPYDEDMVMIYGSESELRLLHYNEKVGYWEDRTVRVDESANTVTGMLDSLSPIIAAISIDGGITNDDSRARDLISGVDLVSPIFSTSETGKSTLTVSLLNTQTIEQDYALIVQIVDELNIVQYLELQDGSLEAKSSTSISIDWIDFREGRYALQLFVITDNENPYLLSDPMQTDLLVSAHP